MPIELALKQCGFFIGCYLSGPRGLDSRPEGCNSKKEGCELTSTIDMPAYADAAIRLRRTLSAIELDCQCRTKLDEALDRFSTLEGRRQLRSRLREARHRRAMIADQISFLADIDEIDEHETDLTVFEEMALLFDEIVSQATRAAQALRQIEAPFTKDANGEKP